MLAFDKTKNKEQQTTDEREGIDIKRREICVYPITRALKKEEIKPILTTSVNKMVCIKLKTIQEYFPVGNF